MIRLLPGWLTGKPKKAHARHSVAKPGAIVPEFIVPELMVIDGQAITVTLKVSAVSRRLTLRVDRRTGGVVVVRPKDCSKNEALAFVRGQGAWLRQHLADLPATIAFKAGSVLPLLGQALTIHADDTARLGRGVTVVGESLYVAGLAAHHPRRITAWLKARAAKEITERVERLAGQVQRPVRAVTLRDTRSRWGSCSANGSLSFSWRLVLAPPFVMDYVVAHEVAHLVEMNHSPRFWAVVESLGVDRVAAQGWLKAHGNELFYYGK